MIYAHYAVNIPQYREEIRVAFRGALASLDQKITPLRNTVEAMQKEAHQALLQFAQDWRARPSGLEEQRRAVNRSGLEALHIAEAALQPELSNSKAVEGAMMRTATKPSSPREH